MDRKIKGIILFIIGILAVIGSLLTIYSLIEFSIATATLSNAGVEEIQAAFGQYGLTQQDVAVLAKAATINLALSWVFIAMMLICSVYTMLKGFTMMRRKEETGRR